MITKNDLKDWLAESERKEYGVKLEEFIDRKIKENALKGETTFYISAGKYTREGSQKTNFYLLWNNENLSDGNRKIVQDNVLEKYREFGFVVEKSSVDCGWNNHYFALHFKDIHKVIQTKEDQK
jgi:hypothetical protein